MDRELIWTERASSDIEAIVRYIARRDPSAGSRIGMGIYHRAPILLEHPEAGTLLAELRNAGWRKLIYKRWKLIYTVREDQVIIGRVWPAALRSGSGNTTLIDGTASRLGRHKARWFYTFAGLSPATCRR